MSGSLYPHRERTAVAIGDDGFVIHDPSSGIAAILEADRRYFERFRHRRHRLRLASTAEITNDLGRAGSDPPPGYRPAVAIRKITPVIRIRAFLFWPEAEEIDIDENWARQVFQDHITETGRRVETALRAALPENETFRP
jgi:hypothetical protein